MAASVSALGILTSKGNLQIIGEASNNLSQKLIANYPQVPWAEIIAFRNILVHEYFRIDLQAV